MRILKKEDWYNLLKMHRSNIHNMVSIWNKDELERFKILTSENNKNGLEISSILNTTWFNMPDSSRVHDIPSFRTLCDLCSENWVFEDEFEMDDSP